MHDILSRSSALRISTTKTVICVCLLQGKHGFVLMMRKSRGRSLPTSALLWFVFVVVVANSDDSCECLLLFVVVVVVVIVIVVVFGKKLQRWRGFLIFVSFQGKHHNSEHTSLHLLFFAKTSEPIGLDC